MRAAPVGWKGGNSVKGKHISNLRFADDTLQFTVSSREMLNLIRRVKEESGKYRLGYKIQMKFIIVASIAFYRVIKISLKLKVNCQLEIKH